MKCKSEMSPSNVNNNDKRVQENCCHVSMVNVKSGPAAKSETKEVNIDED